MVPRDLRALLNLIREYDINEFDFALPGFRVRVVRRPPVRNRNQVDGYRVGSAGAEWQEAITLAKLYEDGDLHLVRSPRIGVFSPSINDRGNREISTGCRVTRSTVLGSITALGISSHVFASVDGVLAAIYVTDGQHVEYGQMICAIAV